MKSLKEPLSRLANREDQTRGAFFEGRFKSMAILDQEALLATCTYIDLNPAAAGIATVPVSSAHTSIKERVAHVQTQGRTDDLNASREGSAAGSAAAAGLEESHWLCPIEDRRRLDSAREGMVEGLALRSYLQLVDYTPRLYRAGKAAVSRDVAAILDRLGSTAEEWQARLEKLRQGRFLGRYFATTPGGDREFPVCRAEALAQNAVEEAIGGRKVDHWHHSYTTGPHWAPRFPTPSNPAKALGLN